MSELASYSTIVVLGVGTLIALYKAFIPRRSARTEQKEQENATKFMRRALQEDESEKKLYLAILEQLGECFQVQFGTSISTVLAPVGNSNLHDLPIDILLADPSSLTPKLAVFLTAGGRVWLGSGNKQLDAVKALGDCGIPVISLPKQDFYNIDKLISEILDALSPPSRREEFFQKISETTEQ